PGPEGGKIAGIGVAAAHRGQQRIVGIGVHLVVAAHGFGHGPTLTARRCRYKHALKGLAGSSSPFGPGAANRARGARTKKRPGRMPWPFPLFAQISILNFPSVSVRSLPRLTE